MNYESFQDIYSPFSDMIFFSQSLGGWAAFGVIVARAGGAGVLAGAWRITFWDELAMAIAAGVASLFGAVV